jgi:hypothetical protein
LERADEGGPADGRILAMPIQNRTDHESLNEEEEEAECTTLKEKI